MPKEGDINTRSQRLVKTNKQKRKTEIKKECEVSHERFSCGPFAETMAFWVYQQIEVICVGLNFFGTADRKCQITYGACTVFLPDGADAEEPNICRKWVFDLLFIR